MVVESLVGIEKKIRVSSAKASWGALSKRVNRPTTLLTSRTMELANASAEALRKRISATEETLRELKEQLTQIEHGDTVKSAKTPPNSGLQWPLLPEEYKRYGRQMIVPSIGILGNYLPNNKSDPELFLI